MRETMRDPGRVEHIMMAINNIEEFTQGMSYDVFVNDKRTVFATIYNIQIIGEAAYKLTKEFKASHPELPWNLMEKNETRPCSRLLQYCTTSRMGRCNERYTKHKTTTTIYIKFHK